MSGHDGYDNLTEASSRVKQYYADCCRGSRPWKNAKSYKHDNRTEQLINEENGKPTKCKRKGYKCLDCPLPECIQRDR